MDEYLWVRVVRSRNVYSYQYTREERMTVRIYISPRIIIKYSDRYFGWPFWVSELYEELRKMKPEAAYNERYGRYDCSIEEYKVPDSLVYSIIKRNLEKSPRRMKLSLRDMLKKVNLNMDLKDFIETLDHTGSLKRVFAIATATGLI